jgi:hypothetical protein
MIIASASRLAIPSPFASTTRRSRKPVCSRGRQPSSDHHACARPAHLRDQTPSPPSVPPATLRAAPRQPGTREPPAILKSP